jgi:trehalose-6-phosphatase
VLEVRPPVPIDKGRGIVLLLRKRRPPNGLYVGDDVTDLDGPAGVRELLDELLR